MSRKVLSILVIFCIAQSSVFAQPMPSLTLFEQNQTFYNPGAIGNQDVLSANFFARQNYVGFENAPSTQVFSAHAPMRNPSVAMGVTVEHDAIHITNYTGLYLNYAYRIRIGENRLSFGLKLGMFSASQSYLNLRDEDPDPTNAGTGSFNLPNAGVGMLYTAEQFWAGLSVPRLLGFESDPSGTYKVDHSVDKYEFFITGGTKVNINPDIRLEPSLLVVYSKPYLQKIHYSINAVSIYQNVYKAGLGYRQKEAIIFIFGYNFNRQFALGYSYDLSVGEIADYSSGSHEIQLQYKFGYKVNATNPRGF